MPVPRTSELKPGGGGGPGEEEGRTLEIQGLLCRP